jgi:hypothetical protein
MTEMLRNGMNPIQLSLIAGASPAVIASSYTHLTKDDAYEAMLRALAAPHDDPVRRTLDYAADRSWSSWLVTVSRMDSGNP